ncbi:MAG: fatty acid desaturase [Deltaproteobacteria bacterium]|nr:fatty acid desaturase [Deltaproteobacteria bacterium]
MGAPMGIAQERARTTAFAADDLPKRPRIPAELYRPRPLASTAMIATALVLFFGGGFVAWRIAISDAPLWLRIAGALPALLVAAHGGHLLGFIGHEGIHLMLYANRHVSMLAGTFFSAMTSFSAVGYGVAHWNHHRYTNFASDPDSQIYPAFQTFWKRFFLARSAGSRSHLRNTIRLARGLPLDLGYRLPFPPPVQRRLAQLNLGFLLFWFTLYVTVAIANPVFALFVVALPILFLVPMSGLRGYLEHAGTGRGLFRDTRSYAHPLYTRLFYGNNFHLEHHLYPAVPCYNLPAVHRRLRDGGELERWRSPVDASLLGPLVHTTAVSQYPCFSEEAAEELRDDPFTASA